LEGNVSDQSIPENDPDWRAAILALRTETIQEFHELVKSVYGRRVNHRQLVDLYQFFLAGSLVSLKGLSLEGALVFSAAFPEAGKPEVVNVNEIAWWRA
jgi:hypothetical protein